MTLRLKDFGWKGRADARDLWAHADAGVVDGEAIMTIPGHGVVMLKLTREKR
jgi:alpha-galactosidase